MLRQRYMMFSVQLNVLEPTARISFPIIVFKEPDERALLLRDVYRRCCKILYNWETLSFQSISYSYFRDYRCLGQTLWFVSRKVHTLCGIQIKQKSSGV